MLKQSISHIKDVFYNKYYPLTVLNRWRARKRNQRTHFTLHVGNCIGGYIYHQLGVAFESPMINMMICDDAFYKIMCRPDYYFSHSIAPFEDPEFPELISGIIDDVIVHFNHYKTFEEGVDAWNRRVKRIDSDNVYIIAADIRLTPEMIADYGNVRCKKLVIFTSGDYDYPWCFKVKRYDGLPHVGNYINKTLRGKWIFEEFFDYIGWLNSDDVVAQHFSLE